jgi:glycosyltransferase involved in cell wall biosynthesis
VSITDAIVAVWTRYSPESKNMRSVLITKFVPWPPNSGEKRRTLAIARALLSQGDVTVFGFTGPNEDAAPLVAEGFDVQSVELDRSAIKTASGVVKSRSLTAARFWDPALATKIDAATTNPVDVLVVEHVQLQMYGRRIVAATRVVDMHNIESMLSRRISQTKRGVWKAVYAAEARALEALEKETASSDAVLVVSPVDEKALREVVSLRNVLVVPNAWDSTGAVPQTSNPVVSFVALLSWGPNVDAAVWLCSEVWPLVVADMPEATLQLVGRDPAPEVREFASDNVIVTGTVAELDPWYEKTLVTVAPLLAGGGSRLKIMEALAAGRPLVATSIGAEGLEDLVGRGVVVADTPRAMANEILSLLRDPAESHRLGTLGAAAVATDHSWEAAVAPLIAKLSAARA